MCVLVGLITVDKLEVVRTDLRQGALWQNILADLEKLAMISYMSYIISKWLNFTV